MFEALQRNCPKLPENDQIETCSAGRESLSRQAGDAYAHEPPIGQFAVQSHVTADVRRPFVFVLTGKVVEVTNDQNFGGAGEQDLMGGLFMRRFRKLQIPSLGNAPTP
jgi:hypothetical protein